MQLPIQLGFYTLLAEIGEGGLAKVYLAVKDGKPYAVKCLKPDQLENPGALAGFVREIKVASRLNHPNIPKCLDEGRSGHTLFAVQELMVGMRLVDMIQEYQALNQPMPLSLVQHIIRECAATLRYLHTVAVFEFANAGLFHGDLSPENIMLTREGTTILCDFGSAGQGSSFDPTHRHLGKLNYLPPEVLAGKPVSTQTDLYSLGVMAYYLLFNEFPYKGDTKLALVDAIQNAPLPRPAGAHLMRHPNDETNLRLFFNTALNKDPKLRFQSATAFLEQFQRLHFAEPPAATALDASKRYATQIDTKMRQQETMLTEAIRDHSKRGAPMPHAGAPVTSLLSHSDRRRHPRVATDPSQVFAEVVAATEKVKLQFAVHEISRGGMLLRWQGLIPQIGGEYPLELRLKQDAPPIRAVGKALYEISRSKTTFVGLECSFSDADIQKIATYVQEKLLAAQNSAEGGSGKGAVAKATASNVQQYLDVFFADLGQFRAEFEKNIRFGGMYIDSELPLQNEEKIIVRVQLPGRLGKILLKARVVYCNQQSQRHGVGVQLEASEAQLRELFQF